jgi:hypothetical protein
LGQSIVWPVVKIAPSPPPPALELEAYPFGARSGIKKHSPRIAAAVQNTFATQLFGA